MNPEEENNDVVVPMPRGFWARLFGSKSTPPSDASESDTEHDVGVSNEVELEEARAALARAEVRIAELEAKLAAQESDVARRVGTIVATLSTQIEDTQAGVVSRVEDSALASEAGVLETGGAVNHIVSRAKEEIEASKRIADELGKGTGLASAVEKQSSAVHGFTRTVAEQIRQQSSVAQKALEHSAEVANAGARIAEIAQASKMLNLNAQIEAARLGKVGEPFAVIAGEMGNLSTRVQEANMIVSRLAEDMQQILPELARRANDMLRLNDTFEKEIEGHLKDALEAESTLRAVVTGSVSESEARVDDILKTSYKALSALQFQDPMQQALRQIPHMTTQLLAGIPDTLKELAPGVDLAEFESLVQVQANDNAAPIAEDDPYSDDEERPDAGEVMLF